MTRRRFALTALGLSFLCVVGLALASSLHGSQAAPQNNVPRVQTRATLRIDLEEIAVQQAIPVAKRYLPMIVQFHSLTPTPTVTPTATWTPSPTPTATPNSLTPLPDLLVDWMKIELETGGSCAYTSPQLGMRVQFSNIGAAAAGPFVLDVNDNQRSFSGLPGGESLTTWLAGSFIWPGMNTSIVDATNLVQESDEENNRLSQIVPIPTLPPTCTATGTPTPTRTHTPTPTPSPWPTGDLWWSRYVHVYDAAAGTQAGIPGAHVHASAISSNSCTTDQNGNCTVTVHAHDTGTVHISVTADGFPPFSGNYPGMPPSGTLTIGLSR